MSDISSHLGLPYIQAAQAQKHVTHNEGIRVLDALVQLSVLTQGNVTPPAEPQPGDRFIVGAGATGDWAGQDKRLAVWDENAWQFLFPAPGWTAWDQSGGQLITFTGTDWIETQPVPQILPQLGINTSADSVNKLAVASPVSLLSHDGDNDGDHRLIINKKQSQDVGSLIFQTGWSARAELGNFPDDTFQINISDDGSTYTTALQIDSPSGIVSQPRTPGFVARGLGSNHTITSDLTPLQLGDGILYDANGDYDTVQGGFVCPVDGLYMFNANVFCQTSTNRGRICFAVNGNVNSTEMVLVPQGGAPVSFTRMFFLRAGHIVDVRTGNANVNLTYFKSHSGWSGVKLS